MNAVFVLVLLYVYCSKATLGIKTSSFCWSYGALCGPCGETEVLFSDIQTCFCLDVTY